MKNGRDEYGIGKLLADKGWKPSSNSFGYAGMVHDVRPGVITYKLNTGEWLHEDHGGSSCISSGSSRGMFAVLKLAEWLELMERHDLKKTVQDRADML